MKSLYEGILSDIDINVDKMDKDIVKVHIYEWLNLHCVPNYTAMSRLRANGYYSSDDDWNLKFNSDGSVDILSDLAIKWNLSAPDGRDGSKIPFKIHKVHGHFYVARSMSDITNFPDIVDSVEFARGIKVDLKNWHLKIENKKEHAYGYHHMPFYTYSTPAKYPALLITSGPTIGKNVVFECTRTSHDPENRTVAVLASLTDSKLKNMKLINFSYVVLEEIRAGIPKPKTLEKYNANIKDTKLITSSLYDLPRALYFEDSHKIGMLIRNENGKFEYVDNKWFKESTATRISQDLQEFRHQYWSLL